MKLELKKSAKKEAETKKEKPKSELDVAKELIKMLLTLDLSTGKRAEGITSAAKKFVK